MKTGKTVHDQKLNLWGDRSDTHSTNPLPYAKQLAAKRKFARANQKREDDIELGNPSIKPAQKVYQFMQLCRGRELRPSEVTSQLYCRYTGGHQPAYRIGPLRLEIVSLQPRIAVIHNFLLDQEVDDIKLSATPQLRRSEMLGIGVNGTVNDQRVSETAWMEEANCSALASVTNRSIHIER